MSLTVLTNITMYLMIDEFFEGSSAHFSSDTLLYPFILIPLRVWLTFTLPD